MINIMDMLHKEVLDFPLFKGMSDDQIEVISPLFEIRQFSAEEIIFRQGQMANCLYILIEGEVAISFKPYDGPPITVSTIVPGGIFGWSTVVGRKFYTSSTIANADSEVLAIPRTSLRQFCKENNKAGQLLLERLASVIAERLDHTHTQILSILTQGTDCETSKE